jgi:hypothetical protein
MVRLAKPGDFCPNKECADYQKLQSQNQRNMIKAGKTKAGVQRHECTSIHRDQRYVVLWQTQILEILAFVAEGNRISSLSRVKGIKEDTILNWLREAAQHTDAVNEVLLKDFKLKRGQIGWAVALHPEQR